jgi:hypothetical protein
VLCCSVSVSRPSTDQARGTGLVRGSSLQRAPRDAPVQSGPVRARERQPMQGRAKRQNDLKTLAAFACLRRLQCAEQNKAKAIGKRSPGRERLRSGVEWSAAETDGVRLVPPVAVCALARVGRGGPDAQARASQPERTGPDQIAQSDAGQLDSFLSNASLTA